MFSGEFKVAMVKEVFKDGYGEMQDVLLGVTDVSSSEPECHLAFFQLPETIQCDALKWGLSDTEVRDNIYTHLMKKVENNE